MASQITNLKKGGENMKAYNFEYAGKTLEQFGMILCQFSGSNGIETVSDGAEISFTTVSVMSGLKHNLTSVNYESGLETTLQICKYSCSRGIQEITPIEHRNLTAWLCRKRFLKFKLFDEANIDLYHEAIINASKIELDGKLVGLELKIQTNRPFALKEAKTISINCTEGKEVYGWKKYKTDPEIEMLGYVISTDANAYPQHKVDEKDEIVYGTKDGYQYYSLGQVYKASLNDTSYEEGYIYPQMEITVKEDGDLIIHNSIENRETCITNCRANEVITMDYPVIKSSDSSHNIQNDFNWTFFRIANTYNNSRNDLVVTLPCSIKIKYSPIVKVGL